jgi:hypothetical protein
MSVRRALLGGVAALALSAPAANATQTGPDYVASDNVQYVTSDRLPGDGVGARVVGKYLYVTTTTGLTIYDIQTDPAHPQKIGFQTFDVEFENEEVPTNGRILGISGQDGCSDPWAANFSSGTAPRQLDPNSTWSASEATGCLTLWDVSDPANVKKVNVVPGAGEHTTACAYDCQWLYGSTGAITDNRDPAKAKVVGNWQRAAVKPDYFKSSCHHLREIQPGVLLGSCQPIILLSLRAQDGASPLKPVIIATGTNEDNRFIHSGQWPNNGTDKFSLEGGETNANPSCDDTSGAFMVWDTSDVRDGNGGFRKGGVFREISEIRPSNGSYTDGHSPYNALGCSVHWFEQHPTFRDGGLVALAEYENGTRFLQITSTGKIIEQGFFLPMAGSTSAPHWNPFDPHYLYVIDYARGLDVLKYTGDYYVPGVPAPPGAKSGTLGTKQSKRAERRKRARYRCASKKKHRAKHRAKSKHKHEHRHARKCRSKKKKHAKRRKTHR